MADQGKWFKLWESSLDDPDLDNLTVHQWFAWARFGAYLKKHGRDGKIRLRAPAQAVTHLLRVPSFDAAIDMIKSFPNYIVEEGKVDVSPVTNETVTFSVESLNWSKYQGDFSTPRVQKHRSKKQRNETLQEEKRGEETKSPSPVGSSSPKSARSAPPDAPAPRASVPHETATANGAGRTPPATAIDADESPEFSRQDFFTLGHRNPKMPETDWDWEHLEQSLTNTERVQSKWRERYHREAAMKGAH